MPNGHPMPDHLQEKSVLVTGGAGFIGKHLVDALVDDNDVRVLDNFSSGSPGALDDRVDLVEGDIRDPDAVERATEDVDVVFHEAGIIDVEESVRNPVGTDDVNCDGTLRVLEAAKEADARVVLASSTAVYGQPTEVPVGESEPKTPLSPYGLQKLGLDHYARLYHELYDVETVALRYFNVYGPGQSNSDYSGVVSVFLERAARGEPLVVHGEGTQTRDFVHVDDVVQANLRAATADVAGEAYNVGTGSSVTINELAELVRDVTNSNVDIVHEDGREGDIEQSEADIRKATDELGYEPTIPLREGVRSLTHNGR